jgi:hypothetical protein
MRAESSSHDYPAAVKEFTGRMTAGGWNWLHPERNARGRSQEPQLPKMRLFATAGDGGAGPNGTPGRKIISP